MVLKNVHFSPTM